MWNVEREDIGKESRDGEAGRMEFPSGPVVGIQHFHYCDLGSIPGWGSKISSCTEWLKKNKNKIDYIRAHNGPKIQ